MPHLQLVSLFPFPCNYLKNCARVTTQRNVYNTLKSKTIRPEQHVNIIITTLKNYLCAGLRTGKKYGKKVGKR